jgi:hypothetical protein
MRNRWIAKVGVAALVVGCAAGASAQSNGPTGISLRIGAFFPTASGVGGTFTAFGADYKLNSLAANVTGSGMIGYWGISADYYSRGGLSNLPLVVNYNMRTGPLVYSLGAGIEFYNLDDFNGSSGTGFDAQAGVAYDITTKILPIFVQAKYYLASHDANRGFGVYVGVRF